MRLLFGVLDNVLFLSCGKICVKQSLLYPVSDFKIWRTGKLQDDLTPLYSCVYYLRPLGFAFFFTGTHSDLLNQKVIYVAL